MPFPPSFDLKRQLYRLKMEDGGNLMDHMSVFNGLVDQLAKVDVEMIMGSEMSAYCRFALAFVVLLLTKKTLATPPSAVSSSQASNRPWQPLLWQDHTLQIICNQTCHPVKSVQAVPYHSASFAVICLYTNMCSV